MSRISLGEVSLDRMVEAVEKVRRRVKRVHAALAQAGIAYALAGGNAVAAWVSRVDEAAVRNTQDVDIVVRRADLPAVKSALAKAGFIYRRAAGIDMFLDGPEAKARDAVHLVFAGEVVRPDYPASAPSVEESEETGGLSVLSLEALVRMKLTSFRDKDRVHLRDLIEVGLLSRDWLDRFAPELAERLRLIFDSPEG
ncbi:MAG: hypothetical protein ACOY3P_25285 [Planctomycetota bacterium]